MLLDIRNLSAAYGAITAFAGVSLSVEQGRIVSVIGANGAGKSSIMNAIAGLIRPSTGSILFDGEEIAGRPPHEIVRKGVVLVPEGRGIFGNLTVLENLDVAATIHPRATRSRRAYDHVFEIFPRLRERRSQPAGTLSGGEQQMLAVGRALVTGSRLLMLDEPSMGLAPNLVEEIFGIIRRINAEGSTILLVEQNARKAMEIAHYAYVLETGRIALAGPAKRLREDPKLREAYLGG